MFLATSRMTCFGIHNRKSVLIHQARNNWIDIPAVPKHFPVAIDAFQRFRHAIITSTRYLNPPKHVRS